MDNNKGSKKRKASVSEERNPKDRTKEKTPEDLQFEDHFEDEFDDDDLEEKFEEMELSDEDDYEVIEGEDGEQIFFKKEKGAEFEEDSDEEMDDQNVKVFRPGVDQLAPGEVLEFDASAYDMLHFMRVEWPCLSFDVIMDKLGFQRERFPHTLYTVAGTQAEKRQDNKLMVFKMSSLAKTLNDDKESDSEDEDDEVDEDPVLEYKHIPLNSCTNRVRAMPHMPNIVALMTDNGHAIIYDISKQLKALDVAGEAIKGETLPSFIFKGHKDEGFALDWSMKAQGRLLTGDRDAKIYLWNPDGASWQVDSTPFSGHLDSVEDVQWSPVETDVFASASVDKTVRIWDARNKNGSALTKENAHDSDVNVISWNEKVTFLVLSGSDDGSFKVWDLRKLNEPTRHYNYHKKPITSLQWNPNDDSGLAVASEDDTVSVWDISVESEAKNKNDEQIPEALLFVHQGQSHIKEVRWHRQIPGVLLSTAYDGFNIFKPNIIEEQQ
jgi:ribosome assembly protein RRB1